MKYTPVVPEEEFKTEAEQCAFEIINFLIEHKIWQDVCVYVGDKRYTTFDGEHHRYESTWDCVFREDGKRAEDYVEYYSDFLTMTFEGPFYDIMNFGYATSICLKCIDEFNAIIRKYGKYYELGYDWSLLLCDI